MTGDGTAANPYTVASVGDWLELEGKSGYVNIISDIDFSNTDGRTSYPGITPAGELYINGNGCTLNYFYQELDQVRINGGMFSTFAGVIKNLNITNAYILGKATNASVDGNAGILASACGKCYFENVSINGFINVAGRGGDTYTGGFFGNISTGDKAGYTYGDVTSGYDVTFLGCKANVNFVNPYRTGGFFGGMSISASSVIFKDCISACKFFGNNAYAGGYTGHVSKQADRYYSYSISQCEFSSNLKYIAGGFEGYTASYGSTQFTNCASICNMTCAVTTSGAVAQGFGGAGFVQCYSRCSFDGFYSVYGFTSDSPGSDEKIVHCYSASTHTNTGAGVWSGLVNYNGANIVASYYDTDLFPDDTTECTAGMSTDMLKSQERLRVLGWAI